MTQETDFMNPRTTGDVVPLFDPELRRRLEQRKEERKLEQEIEQVEREIRDSETQAFLRSRIDAIGILADLDAISNTLVYGYETVRQADGQHVEVPLGRTRVSSLRAAATVKSDLLKKRLPDLSSVTLSGDEGKPLKIVLEGWEAKV
jgi:hypothetical protein